ncbi:hypothetical protein JAGODDHD_04123 [Sphingomonas paucimobilis]|uniref:DUF5983 family protein n=1 Tax=Sphingomonas paucimobilis TaxID=13689 RepID=UPI0024357C92|nr:hypothetical protein [Sphingomonas paucimobilis]MDG5973353.1 hypothetical protein [Sphingomonas paucimobilis]
MDVALDPPPPPDTATAAIEPMLVLSTSHLTDATCNVFLPGYDGPAWPKGAYNWFVYAPEDDDGELPEDLKVCLALARQKGAFWVMFDRDAVDIEELPTYEW